MHIIIFVTFFALWRKYEYSRLRTYVPRSTIMHPSINFFGIVNIVFSYLHRYFR